MVEQQKQRIEQEMTLMINEIDSKFLRKMQADMHRCAAACCENKNLSLEGVQKCVDNCSVTLNWAQSYVQREFEQCQNKLQRCVTDCNDDVRIRMSVNPTQTEIDQFTAQFEVCAEKCVDKQVDYMPALLRQMKTNLARNS